MHHTTTETTIRVHIDGTHTDDVPVLITANALPELADAPYGAAGHFADDQDFDALYCAIAEAADADRPINTIIAGYAVHAAPVQLRHH